MKALLIYSQHDARQNKLIDLADKFQGMVQIVEINDCPDMIKRLVRETPAYITADEHLQGEALIGSDCVALVEATIYERMDMAEKALHNVDNCRLDCHVKEKQTESIDSYTMDLIIEGVIG